MENIDEIDIIYFFYKLLLIINIIISWFAEIFNHLNLLGAIKNKLFLHSNTYYIFFLS